MGPIGAEDFETSLLRARPFWCARATRDSPTPRPAIPVTLSRATRASDPKRTGMKFAESARYGAHSGHAEAKRNPLTTW